MTETEIKALLDNIDATTTHTAKNIQTIADVDQTIASEIDAFLAAKPVGSTISDADVAQLQGLAARAQATSDASDAQVAFLQGLAAKGAPVVPPAPAPVLITPPTPAP